MAASKSKFAYVVATPETAMGMTKYLSGGYRFHITVRAVIFPRLQG